MTLICNEIFYSYSDFFSDVTFLKAKLARRYQRWLLHVHSTVTRSSATAEGPRDALCQ